MRVHRLPLINQRQIALARIFLLCLMLCLSVASSLAQSDKQPQRGFKPGGSYALSDIETISTTNGNLMFNIPLASLPAGRGGSPGASLKLIYNSKIWDPFAVFEPSGSSNVLRTYLNRSPEGGWDYGYKYELQVVDKRYEYRYPYGGEPECNTQGANATKIIKVRMRFPDGGVREFRPLLNQSHERDGYYDKDPEGRQYFCQAQCNSNGCTYFISYTAATYAPISYYSTDGTYLRLDIGYTVPDANGFRKQYWTLSLPDGGRVTSDPSLSGNGTQRIYDRNNNYTEIQNITYNGHPATKIVDALGRAIIIEKDTTTGQDYVYAQGVGNVELKTTVKWKQIRVYKTIATGDYGSSSPLYSYAPGYGFIVVDQVILSQQTGGLSYRFDYNASTTSPSNGWGEVSSVLLPSGARVNYTYRMDGLDNLSSLVLLKNHVVTKDLIYDSEYDGTTTEKTETWQYKLGDGTLSSYQYLRWSEVKSPAEGVTKQKFYNGDYNGSERPLTGMVYYTENPDGSVVERKWQNNIVFGGAGIEPNPYVKTEFTSIRDAAGLSKTAIKDYSYDKNGNVTQIKEYDWVAYSSVPRDADGRPTGVPAGAPLKRIVTNDYYSPTPDAVDTTTYDAEAYAQPSAPRLRNSIKSNQISNGSQVLTRSEFFYDNAATTGNLTEQKNWDSTKGAYSSPLTTSNSVSVSHLYDVYGNLTVSTDARGYQSKLIYGSVGGFTDLYPTQTISAFGTSIQRTSSQVYDFNAGLVTSTTDVDNNVTTETDYDVFGRPIEVRAAANVPSVKTVTRMEYSDVARRVITRSDLNTAYDGKLVSIQHYDQLGRVRLTRQLEDAATQSAEDETTGIKVQTRYSFSGSNSYQITSNPYRAATSDAASSEATMGWTRSKSDNGGRIIGLETFSGSSLPAPWGANTLSTGVVTSAYDANYVTVTDQAGRVRRSMTDALGRLARVDESNASNSLGTVDTPVQPTIYMYDALGNLTQVNQGVQTRSFTYSSLSRLTSATNPEAVNQQGIPVPITYQYDNNGNLTQKVDARNVATTYSYDALNRVMGRSYTDGTPAVTYTYDTVTYGKGRLTSVSNSVSTTSYGQYDALGRVKQSSQLIDGQLYQMSYGYDLAGNLTSQTYPSGRTVTMAYDKAGRLRQVNGQKTGEANKPYASAFTYSAHGAVTEMKLGNKLWEHTIFNSRLQPVLIGLGTSQATLKLQDFNRFRVDYSYGGSNNNGNVLQQTITVPDVSGNYVAQMAQVYTYDELNRLKSAQENNGASWKQTFVYDRYGNRTFDTNNTTQNALGSLLTIDPANNRFTANQGYIQYDSAGNLTRDFNGHTFTYDAENKQTGYDGGATAGRTSYFYDGDGRRVKKVNGTGRATTVFVYNAMGQMVAEYESNLPQQSGGTSYLTTDSLGTPRVITDSTGDVKARHDYLPFGEEIAYNLGGRSDSQKYVYGIGNPDHLRHKFTSKERDIETGLDYFGARYYASAQGRFTSVDPMNIKFRHLLDPQNLNRYTYVTNNPLKFIDPDGKEKIMVIIRTFIPARTVSAPIAEPPPLGKAGSQIRITMRTFEGDDRKAGQHPERFRTEQRIIIETDPSKNGGNALYSAKGRTGITREILPDGGRVEAQAKGDTLKADAKYFEGASNTVIINASGNETNPLIRPSVPGITYELNIMIGSSGPNTSALVSINGQHDGFPGYEVTIVRPETGDESEHLVTSYDPDVAGESGLALYPPMDKLMTTTRFIRGKEK